MQGNTKGYQMGSYTCRQRENIGTKTLQSHPQVCVTYYLVVMDVSCHFSILSLSPFPENRKVGKSVLLTLTVTAQRGSLLREWSSSSVHTQKNLSASFFKQSLYI